MPDFEKLTGKAIPILFLIVVSLGNLGFFIFQWTDFHSEGNGFGGYYYETFKKMVIFGSDFSFIPIGMNLYGFDLISLIYRLNHYFNLNLSVELFRNRPVIDIKSILIMMNDGQFKGYNSILGKKQPGNVVRTYYENKDYDKIIEYIKDETANFIEKYQILRKEVPNLRGALA